MNLLRLIAFPDDDVAFQAALDNDIILSSISSSDIEQVIMPKVRETSSKKGSSFLEAARECVLTKKLPSIHEKVITEFLRKFDVWNSDQQKYFRKGENSEKSVNDILKAAFSLRWNSIYIAVARLSNSAAGYESLHQFISAIRLEGDFVEDSGGSRGDFTLSDKDIDNHDQNINNYGNLSHRTAANINLVPGSAASPPRLSRNGNRSKDRNPKLTIWVMAMHAAKGLEFDEVILPFWSKGTMMDKELPSERKIAFMSLTRAKERVMISYSRSRKLNNIQRVSTGASLFVESLLQIPGLKMTHEDVSSTLKQAPLSYTGPGHKSNNNYSNTVNNNNHNSNNNENSYNGNNDNVYSKRNYGYNAVAKNNYDSLEELQSKYSNMETNSYIGKYSQSASSPPNVNILGTAGTLLKPKTSPSTLRSDSVSSSPSIPVINRIPPSVSTDTSGSSSKSSIGNVAVGKMGSGELQLSGSGSGSGSGGGGHPYLCGELKDIVLKTRSIKSGSVNGDNKANIGNMISTSDTLNKIITEKVISNSVQKLKKESLSKDEILKQFPGISSITPQEIKKLLIDKNNAIKKSDLVILFREILKSRFGILKGSIPVIDKDNNNNCTKIKREKDLIMRSISTCTSAQLGEHLMKLMIKKNSL